MLPTIRPAITLLVLRWQTLASLHSNPARQGMLRLCADELDAALRASQGGDGDPRPSLALRLLPELRAYLDTLTITGDTIGDIRRQCFVPWESEWNGIVRDETAQREKASAPSEGVPDDTKMQMPSRAEGNELSVNSASPPQRPTGDASPLAPEENR